MDTKRYYIFIIILAVVVGTAAFYFLKPAKVTPPESVKLDENALQNLTGQNQTPPLPKPQPNQKRILPKKCLPPTLPQIGISRKASRL